ncbi:hypothetical protein V8G54_000312 [Vigna mungo]|uniref:RRM domain-containing protein n=1 Tax=Vigna mungo TaxID=3915 RepID=A0AAQ3S9T3_VIGMU
MVMEMSMLAPSFPGFAKPSATVKPSLLTLRASSLRHDYPLASKIVVKSNIRSHPLTLQFHLVEASLRLDVIVNCYLPLPALGNVLCPTWFETFSMSLLGLVLHFRNWTYCLCLGFMTGTKARILHLTYFFTSISTCFYLEADLPYSTGETTLQKEFSNFGKIAEVKMVKDVKTKRSKGIAFIQYTCQDDAMLALETMDQKDFYGRTIYVEIARLGWDYFGATPRASGPPKKWDLPEQEEVVDCWY